VGVPLLLSEEFELVIMIGLKASRLNSVTIVKVKAVLEMVGMGGKEANQKNRPQQRDPARRDSRGCRVPWRTQFHHCCGSFHES